MNIDALSKEKFQLQCDDIIEIFPPEEQEAANQKSHLLLQVKALPQDLQSKGTAWVSMSWLSHCLC